MRRWLISLVLVLSIPGTRTTGASFGKYAPEPVEWDRSPEPGVVFGDGWVAYPSSRSAVRVADRGTNAEILRLEMPTGEVPIEGKPGWTRSFATWGSIAAHGDRLAMLCFSTITRRENGVVVAQTGGHSVLLWEIPSGQLLGISDIDLPFNGGPPFLGLSAERLAVVGTYHQRRIYQWDARTLAALPTVTIPESLPFPGTATAGNDVPSIVMGDRRVIYRPSAAASSQQLVVVDLDSASCSLLPGPAGLMLTNEGGLAVRGDRLVFVTRSYTQATLFDRPLHLVHYDLSTSTVVTVTTFAEAPPTSWYNRPLLGADGRWILAPATEGTARPFFSGHHGTAEPDISFTYGDPDSLLGVPLAWVEDEIWFAAPPALKSDARAWILRTPTLPKSGLTAEVLPCEERDGTLQIRVSLSKSLPTATSFRVRTVAGSATPGADYQPMDSVHAIPAGATEVMVSIPLIQDQVIEPNESLFIEIEDSGPEVIQSQVRHPAVIRGSSFNLLPPLAPYLGTPGTQPDTVHLAGGRLVQGNRIAPNSVLPPGPALVIRPFAGGDWNPSASWNRTLAPGTDFWMFSESSGGRIVIRDQNSATAFDAANDEVLHRITGRSNTGVDFIGSDRFVTPAATGAAVEYDLTPPFAARTLPRPPGNPFSYSTGTYTHDSLLLVVSYSGAVERYSRADGSFTGLLIPSGPWDDRPRIASDGQHVAIASKGRVWIFRMDTPGDIRELDTGSAVDEPRVSFQGGYLHVWSAYRQAAPRVQVFEPTTGVEVDQLFQDLTATVPEGSMASDELLPNVPYLFNSFSPEGSDAASFFSIRGLPRIVRFSRNDDLPSLSTPGAVKEGGPPLVLSFTEASSSTITVTTRAIIAGSNQVEDWPLEPATVVVPPGTTTFDSGLAPLDDRLPEDPDTVAFEVTLTGGGHSEVRRISARIEDNDRVKLVDLPHTSPRLDPLFAASGGSWAYRGSIPGSLLWTGDPDFNARSPYGWGTDYSFPAGMAGDGDWLAVTHDTWGGTFGTKNPSSVFLFKPATQQAPVRILKGMGVYNRFGRALFARGDTLWVGAPGTYGVNASKKIQVKGAAFEYHMPTGKRLRTFKAPKDYVMNFGWGFTANDNSVWIASPAHLTRPGAVLQYSRSTGKWLRSIPVDLGLGAGESSGRMTSNADTLVVVSTGSTAPAGVNGHDAATGKLLWTLNGPGGGYVSTVEMIREDLLAVGGGTVTFYKLTPGSPPVLLLEIWSYDNPITRMESSGSELMVHRGDFGDQRWTLIDLRDVPHLEAWFPAPASAARLSGHVNPPDPSIPSPVLSRLAGGAWQLSLPETGDGTILESSTDLVRWHPRLVRREGEWQLQDEPDHGGLEIMASGALRITDDQPRAFFRLRTP
jgi:hypothetical protein